MTDDELRDAIGIMEQRARKGAPSLWDLILDARALIRGVATIKPRDQIERDIERALQVKW